MNFKKLLATGIATIALISSLYLPVNAENLEDSSYDDSTSIRFSEIEDLIYSIGIGGVGGDNEINANLTSFSTTINGKTIPLSGYGIGDKALTPYGGATFKLCF